MRMQPNSSKILHVVGGRIAQFNHTAIGDFNIVVYHKSNNYPFDDNADPPR